MPTALFMLGININAATMPPQESKKGTKHLHAITEASPKGQSQLRQTQYKNWELMQKLARMAQIILLPSLGQT